MALQMPSRLYRSRSEKMIAGVCGGLGEYFDVDPVLIRLLFVVTTLLSGVGLLAYIVLWILVPRQGEEGTPRTQVLRGEVEDLYRETRERIDPGSTQPTAATGSAADVGPTTPGDVAAGEPMSADPVAGDPDARPTGETMAGGTVAGGSDDLSPPRSAPPLIVTGFAERRRRRQHWAGAILIIIGVLFLAQNLGLLWWIEARFLVPLLLVGVGGWLLFGKVRGG